MAKRSFRMSPWNDRPGHGYFVRVGDSTIFCSIDPRKALAFIEESKVLKDVKWKLEDEKGKELTFEDLKNACA